MKGIIVYKGKYGATRQYADWLAQELELSVLPADNLASPQLKEYDVILIGTSVYTGQLKIAAWIKENQSILKDKKLFLFLVSATKPTEKEKLDAYVRSGIPDELRRRCKIFYLPGRMILQKLSWQDRFLLKMVARFAKNSDGKKNKPVDFDHVKKEHLSGMIGAVKQTLVSEKMVLSA
jgi:menaquinone-dependent protoporphyrinogen IX oxidase